MTGTAGTGHATTRTDERAAAFARFQACVAEVLDVEPASVRPGARWRDDLDADSLAVAEIILALDDEFGVRLPDLDPESLSTVDDAFAVLAELLGATAG